MLTRQDATVGEDKNNDGVDDSLEEPGLIGPMLPMGPRRADGTFSSFKRGALSGLRIDGTLRRPRTRAEAAHAAEAARLQAILRVPWGDAREASRASRQDSARGGASGASGTRARVPPVLFQF
jgi:hypothetical protein